MVPAYLLVGAVQQQSGPSATVPLHASARLSSSFSSNSQELMEVVRCETVPLCVRGAFALLVERMHLDVAPLLPKPPVRYLLLYETLLTIRWIVKFHLDNIA